ENRTNALDEYERALRIAQEIGDRPLLASILGNIGMTYSGEGDLPQALDYLQRSIGISEEIGAQRAVCQGLQSTGEIYFKQGEYARAVEVNERTASMSERIGLPDTLANSLTAAASAYRKLNQLDKASGALLRAIQVVEKMRTLVAGGDQERQGFLEYWIAPYYLMADLQLDRNNLPEALVLAERAKARTLVDALGAGRVDISKSM